jgi:uncharacterized protein YbjT (DUF2867 family)
MNIILGASGQVGSAIVNNLLSRNEKVKAIIRNPDKANTLQTNKNLTIEVADAFDLPALENAFKNGDTIFLLTPETGNSDDVIGDTKKILTNYRKAIENSTIKKIVGLSSMGAQHENDSGNLKMSYLLEHSFMSLDIQKIFVRPAYYYSNWMNYISVVQDTGVLPSFYPVDLKIAMISPLDVAQFVADIMVRDIEGEPVFEVQGPESYNATDIANIFGKTLGREVNVQQIPRQEWAKTLQGFGFTADATKNFIEMTQMVVDGKTGPEGKGTIPVKVTTGFSEYLAEHIHQTV